MWFLILMILTLPAIAEEYKTVGNEMEIKKTVVDVKVVSLDDLIIKANRLQRTLNDLNSHTAVTLAEIDKVNALIVEARSRGLQTQAELKAIADEEARLVAEEAARIAAEQAAADEAAKLADEEAAAAAAVEENP